MVPSWISKQLSIASLPPLAFRYQSSSLVSVTQTSRQWRSSTLTESHCILMRWELTNPEMLFNSCSSTSSETITFSWLEKSSRKFQNKWPLISSQRKSAQIQQAQRWEQLNLLRRSCSSLTGSSTIKELCSRRHLHKRDGMSTRLTCSSMDLDYLSWTWRPLPGKLQILNSSILWNGAEIINFWKI